MTNFVFIGLRILVNLVNRIDKANGLDKANGIDKANEPIQKYFEEYVYKMGMDAIDRISSTANKVN